MFTVKLVEHSGHEQIHPAKRVWADKARMEDGSVHPNDTDVYYSDENDETHKFENYGVAYVMNENGQTVAKYFLGYGKERCAPPNVEPKKKAT